MRVSMRVRGSTVVARPVYKGGPLPAYWTATIDNRSVLKKFTSAREIFEFVRRRSP